MSALLERAVARALIMAYNEDWGPAGSNPLLQSTVTSKTLQEAMEQAGTSVEHYTVVSILEGFNSQDYILLAPKSPSEEGERQVSKVFPIRLKRMYNLWEIEEC